MADQTNVINPQILDKQQEADILKEIKKEEQEKKHKQNDNVLLFAIFEVLSAINIQQQSAGHTVKALQFEVNQQAKLNAQQAQLKFVTLSFSYRNNVVVYTNKKAVTQKVRQPVSAQKLNDLTTDNEIVNAQRGYVTTQITIDQQNTQINSSKVSQQTDTETQEMQTTSALLNMTKSISDQIGSMNRR